VPHREDEHENDKIKEESNKPAEQHENPDVPGKHATPGRREFAAPRSAPG
jgi:hypothetical protein